MWHKEKNNFVAYFGLKATHAFFRTRMATYYRVQNGSFETGEPPCACPIFASLSRHIQPTMSKNMLKQRKARHLGSLPKANPRGIGVYALGIENDIGAYAQGIGAYAQALCPGDRGLCPGDKGLCGGLCPGDSG